MQNYVGEKLLNSVYEQLQQMKHFWESMDELFYGLRELRNSMTETEWKTFSSRCIQHPLKRLLHQDPFTYRAYARPRGYAGDAVLLDFIYGDDLAREKLHCVSETGRKIYEYTTSAPASRAVRERRNIITQMIDEISDTVVLPHILSVACGHLNEAKHSEAVRNNRIGRYVAFDQDLKSLEVVEQEFNERDTIECVHGTVKELIRKRTELGNFDFIYALGLFDYLSQPIGRRLASIMFEMLRPGGRILIGNCVPHIRDVGYMETYMDWKLVYRSGHEIEELSADIDNKRSERRIFVEKNQNIAFLEVYKT